MKKTFIVGAFVVSLFVSGEALAAEYTVQPNDTLWKISKESNISVSDLKSKNQLTSDTIYIGQKLQISGESAPSSNTSTYKVQAGDYLSVIAKRFGTTTNQILHLNPGITNPDILKIGQVITVPSSESQKAELPQTNSGTYIVKSGDYLSLIAKKFGLSTNELLSLNPSIKNPDILSIGQTINVKNNGGNVVESNWEDKANAIIASGKKYLGAPYLYGASPSRTDVFDCSSFTQRVFSENGISLPRTSVAQSSVGKTIPLSQARKGDLLFFDTDFDGVINHVSIYIDNSTVLHAATSKGVSIANTKYYWNERFVKAVRVTN